VHEGSPEGNRAAVYVDSQGQNLLFLIEKGVVVNTGWSLSCRLPV